MLEVVNLSVTRNHSRVLNKVNFAIQEATLTAIIGPNGAGKSTLLNALAGEVKPSGGRIELLYRDIDSWPNTALAKQLAVLPQSSQLNFPFSVREIIAMGRTPHATGVATDNAIIDETQAAMDLNTLSTRLYTQLSGGEKQRVQIARVLTQIWRSENAQPRLLLLDEPTNAMDVAHQHLLMRCIRQFSFNNTAVIMVMHDFNLAAQYADRIITLNGGELYADGTPHEILTPQLFSDVFNVSAALLTHPVTQKPIVTII